MLPVQVCSELQGKYEQGGMPSAAEVAEAVQGVKQQALRPFMRPSELQAKTLHPVKDHAAKGKEATSQKAAEQLLQMDWSSAIAGSSGQQQAGSLSKRSGSKPSTGKGKKAAARASVSPAKHTKAAAGSSTASGAASPAASFSSTSQPDTCSLPADTSSAADAQQESAEFARHDGAASRWAKPAWSVDSETAASAHQANVNAAQPDEASGRDTESCAVTACSEPGNGFQSEAVIGAAEAHDNSVLPTNSQPSNKAIVSGLMVYEPSESSQHAAAQRDDSDNAGTSYAARACQEAVCSHTAHHDQQEAFQGTPPTSTVVGLLLRVRNQALALGQMQPPLRAVSPPRMSKLWPSLLQ